MRNQVVVAACLFVGALSLRVDDLFGQVYGYTNDNGVLILSNVPSDPRMSLIAEGSPEPAGRIWRYSGQYDTEIFKAANLSGLDSALVKAVIAIESGFNRFARSHKGAMGLMQLMPETCRRYSVVNPYEPWQNLRAGARHLRDLLDEFNDLNLSLAAYNAGATTVRKYGNIPPYPETRDYVRKVMAIYRAGSKISITKGGRVYTMTPGGGTVVSPAPVVASRNGATRPESRPQGGGTSLAELAAASRRNAPNDPSRAATSSPVSSELASSDPPAELVQPGNATTASGLGAADSPSQTAGGLQKEEPIYYRYTDAEGIVYITRRKPDHADYEILRP